MIFGLESYQEIDGVKIITPIDDSFERLYLKVRAQEKRVLTDDQTRRLPQIDPNYPHYSEWLVRAKTADRFKQYVKDRKDFRTVLDLGCGNGWFSNMLCRSLKDINRIYGIDINMSELKQARRVFPR